MRACLTQARASSTTGGFEHWPTRLSRSRRKAISARGALSGQRGRKDRVRARPDVEGASPAGECHADGIPPSGPAVCEN